MTVRPAPNHPPRYTVARQITGYLSGMTGTIPARGYSWTVVSFTLDQVFAYVAAPYDPPPPGWQEDADAITGMVCKLYRSDVRPGNLLQAVTATTGDRTSLSLDLNQPVRVDPYDELCISIVFLRDAGEFQSRGVVPVTVILEEDR